MQYPYHAQYQALEKAEAIPPVPADYPLRAGLWPGFQGDFAALAALGRRLYRAMAEAPEAYGLAKMDAADLNHGRLNWGPIRVSEVSTRRAVQALYALCTAGTWEGEALRVDGSTFRAQLKQDKVVHVAGVLAALGSLGLRLDGYSARCGAFHAAWPDAPNAYRALKAYCDLRLQALADPALILADPDDFKDRFYAFDYRYTADLAALGEDAWVREHIRSWDAPAQAFYLAFREAMRPLQKVRCAGDFFLGTKCVARLRYEDDAWKHRIDAYTVPEYKAHIHGSMAICFALILPLPIQGDPDRFQAVPPHIAAFMKAKKCQDCDAFAGRKAKNNGVCPHTVRWTYEGEAHRGCSYYCFHFENPDIADIPAYVDMMRGAFSLR